MRNAYKILVGKHEGKARRCKWKDNIERDHVERRCEGVGWIQGSVVG
jgi:hypothetical protein